MIGGRTFEFGSMLLEGANCHLGSKNFCSVQPRRACLFWRGLPVGTGYKSDFYPKILRHRGGKPSPVIEILRRFFLRSHFRGLAFEIRIDIGGPTITRVLLRQRLLIQSPGFSLAPCLMNFFSASFFFARCGSCRLERT